MSKKSFRVVSISHSALSRFGRLRYLPLAAGGDVDLTLVVPRMWKEYGREIIADPPTPCLNLTFRPIRLASVGKAKWYMHYYPGLSELINELDPDVLHLWEEPWSFVAFQAARVCARRRSKTALVLETDQNILRRLPPPFEQIRRYTLRRVDSLIVRHPEALEVSRACGYQGPAVIVEYCIDPREFRQHDRTQARVEFATNGFTVGYVGRLVAEKGLFTVLDALHTCNPDVRFLLLGNGPDRERLLCRVHELGLKDRVTFFAGGSQEKVIRFLNALDALVLMSRTTPTWKEQFGRVIMEAQACGVPVIGSDSGAIPSVIDAGGWIIRESDAIGLRDLLDRLAVNPNEVATAGAEGLRQAQVRFSAKKVSSDLRNALRKAVRSRESTTGNCSAIQAVK